MASFATNYILHTSNKLQHCAEHRGSDLLGQLTITGRYNLTQSARKVPLYKRSRHASTTRLQPRINTSKMAASRFFVVLVLALCAILLAAQQVEGARQLRGADIDRSIVNCKTFGEELLVCSF